MPMRRMGHLACRQRGFMHLNIFAGHQNAGDHPSHGPAVRQVGDRKLVVGKCLQPESEFCFSVSLAFPAFAGKALAPSAARAARARHASRRFIGFMRLLSEFPARGSPPGMIYLVSPPIAITRYFAVPSPTFLAACLVPMATKITPPGPTLSALPSCSKSSVPSCTRMSSEC